MGALGHTYIHTHTHTHTCINIHTYIGSWRNGRLGAQWTQSHAGILVSMYVHVDVLLCMYVYCNQVGVWDDFPCKDTQMFVLVYVRIHYACTSIHTRINTCIHTCIHAYIHTYIHTYTHTCYIHIHIYVQHTFSMYIFMHNISPHMPNIHQTHTAGLMLLM